MKEKGKMESSLSLSSHWSHSSIQASSAAYWPPLLAIGGGGAGTNVGVGLLFWAASFAIFAIIPKTAEIIQSFIQGKPFSYGTAIGEATTGLIMPGTKAVTLLSQVVPPVGRRLTNLRKEAGSPAEIASGETPGVPVTKS